MSDVTVQPVSGDDPYGKTPANTENTGEMQQVNVGVDPKEDTQKDAMIKKAEAGTDPNKLIAGKFKTQEDFDKSILEAVKKKHGGKLEDYYKSLTGNLKPEVNPTENTEVKPEVKPEGDDKGEQKIVEPDANGEVKQGDLTPFMSQFTDEYGKDGKLSDDSYTKLETAGYDRGTVDTFLKGVQATQNELFNRVGGKENYTTMTSWAAENLSEADINLFNDDLNSGAMVRMERAIDLLHSKFKAANGGFAPKQRVSPEGGDGVGAPAGYQSIAEMKKDMSDPRYATDPAFRNMVKEKVRYAKF